jgi:hypothetical protein
MNRTVVGLGGGPNAQFALAMAIEWSIGHQTSASSEVILKMADRYWEWLETKP